MPAEEQKEPTKNTLDNGVIRFDFVFSYWILIWFLIYYFANPKTSNIAVIIKKYFNPKLAFILGLTENILTLFFLFIFGKSFDIMFFAGSVVFLKSIPLYLMRYDKIIWKNDSFVLFFVFVLYNVYLYMNDTNVYNIYLKTIRSLIEQKNQTPMYNFISRFYKYFTNK